MAYDTAILQGRFTADGKSKTIRLRSDLDWMRVYNYTQAAASNSGYGFEYYWQRGMADGTGALWAKSNTGVVSAFTMSSGGFTLVDTSAPASPEFAAKVAITSSTDATQPVFTVASTAALSTGDIVKFSNIAGQTSLNGYEFEIEVINGTTFRPRYAMANAPGVAGTGGYYRLRLRPPMFSPYRYFVGNISAADDAVITFTTQHGFQIGDDVRISISDPVYGDYATLNDFAGQVLATTASTITVSGWDTSDLGAFGFPLPAQVPFSPATVLAFGGNNESDDEINEAYIGIRLGAGTVNPAGNADDVIYWVAGKSFSVDNE